MITLIRFSLMLTLALLFAVVSSVASAEAPIGARAVDEAWRKAIIANAHYQTSGNLSVGWGDFTLTLSPKAGGSSVSLSGRFSVIAKKEGRKWVYVVDHASAHPASPAPR